MYEYEEIGSMPLWMKRVGIPSSCSWLEIQGAVNVYAERHRVSVVGYYATAESDSRSFTMLRWPDNREGYQVPSVDECEIAFAAIAKRIRGRDEVRVLEKNMVHAMIGRRIDGYQDEAAVQPLEIMRGISPGLAYLDGTMVSARVHKDGVKPYNEPVGIATGPAHRIDDIHYLAGALRQHHYAIESTVDNATRLYQTEWAYGLSDSVRQ